MSNQHCKEVFSSRELPRYRITSYPVPACQLKDAFLVFASAAILSDQCANIPRSETDTTSICALLQSTPCFMRHDEDGYLFLEICSPTRTTLRKKDGQPITSRLQGNCLITRTGQAEETYVLDSKMSMNC